MGKIILPICMTIIFTLALLLSGGLPKKMGLAISSNSYINLQISYQIILLFITGLSILVTFLINRENFMTYFSLGQITIPGNELHLFGIKRGDSWLKTGLSLCVVITSVTAIFMYFQLKKVDVNWSILQSGVIWILLFSVTNSFGEEMIFRLGLVSPLTGLLSPTTIFFISAIIFGLAHVNGMPSGIIGITLAAILGFVLAKSVFETQGFFWAWMIHFLQDVVIIGSLYLINTAKST
jgi:membrane protease YdiL (CAAX protease family)